MGDFSIKVGDLKPDLKCQLFGSDNLALTGLAGCTIKLRMWRPGAQASKVYAAAVIDDSANAIVHYSWQGTDTDTAGLYYAEWEITDSGGKKQTPPTGNTPQLTVEVQARGP